MDLCANRANVLTNLLSLYICKVFDNEEDFLTDLTDGLRDCELLECYMASERTKIVVVDHDGQHITTTVPTAKVAAWCDER